MNVVVALPKIGTVWKGGPPEVKGQTLQVKDVGCRVLWETATKFQEPVVVATVTATFLPHRRKTSTHMRQRWFYLYRPVEKGSTEQRTFEQPEVETEC